MAISAYSITSSLNTSINGVNIGEGMSRSDVNNAFREFMADIKAGVPALPVSVDNGGTGSGVAATALANLGGLGVEYRVLRRVNKTAAFTMADAEGGYGIVYTGAAAVVTLDPESTTPMTDGSIWVIRNVGSGALTITPGAGVSLFVNGATSSSSATIAIGGVATIISWYADNWTVTGPSVS